MEQAKRYLYISYITKHLVDAGFKIEGLPQEGKSFQLCFTTDAIKIQRYEIIEGVDVYGIQKQLKVMFGGETVQKYECASVSIPSMCVYTLDDENTHVEDQMKDTVTFYIDFHSLK
jgi:hypothetical protein